MVLYVNCFGNFQLTWYSQYVNIDYTNAPLAQLDRATEVIPFQSELFYGN